jgi:hypothetical protein
MAARSSTDADFVDVVVVRHGDSDTRARISTRSRLASLFRTYSRFRGVDVGGLSFYFGSPPRLLYAEQRVCDVAIESGSRILCMPFTPFEPEYASHSDMAFAVGGWTFSVHKFPMLRSNSPLIDAMVELYDGNPVPLDVPGGARVFDVIVRLCHSENVDRDAQLLLCVWNVCAVRIAAMFLQMDKLVRFARVSVRVAAAGLLESRLLQLQ